jgi:uncharacterized repeat protein (TIGR02543 family)
MSDTAAAVDAQAACTLWVKAEGTGVLEYAWYRASVKLNSAISDSLLLTSVSLADTGVYYCRVTNAWGEKTSIGIRLRVLFRVFYDGNENTGGMAPVDTNGYEPGAIATTLGNPGSLSRRGYTFAGWNTKADGSGKGYGENDLLEMGDEAIILYAQWSNNPTFTVTYDRNGAVDGTVPVDARRYEEGDTVVVAGNTGNLVKTGNTFTGWNTQPQGDSGTAYTPGSVFIVGAKNDTLYAQWEINRYTITYDGNGENVSNVPLPTTHRYNAELTLDTAIPDRTGHTFFRWNTAPTGDGEDYKPGDKFTIGDRNVTLYARWTVNRYAIAYVGNGNTAGKAPDSVTSDYNTPLTIAGKGSLERTGYSFTGWNTEADGGGSAYPADTTVAMGAGDLTLFAQWKVNGYIVIFNARGGTPAKTERAAHYGDTVTPPAVSMTGYSLDNWYRDSAYTTVWEFAEDTVMGNMTLYAKWTANSYTVTFDKNDNAASGSMAAQTIACGATESLTAYGFSKTGWSFAGWADSAGGGVVYTDGADYTMGAGNDTLYAQWEQSYKVYFQIWPDDYRANLYWKKSLILLFILLCGPRVARGEWSTWLNRLDLIPQPLLPQREGEELNWEYPSFRGRGVAALAAGVRSGSLLSPLTSGEGMPGERSPENNRRHQITVSISRQAPAGARDVRIHDFRRSAVVGAPTAQSTRSKIPPSADNRRIHCRFLL